MFQFFNNFGDKIIEARLLFFSRLKSPVTSLSSTYTRLKAARPEVATIPHMTLAGNQEKSC